MRFIILVLGVLSHFPATVLHAAAEAGCGQRVGTVMSASAHADEAHPCRI